MHVEGSAQLAWGFLQNGYRGESAGKNTGVLGGGRVCLSSLLKGMGWILLRNRLEKRCVVPADIVERKTWLPSRGYCDAGCLICFRSVRKVILIARSLSGNDDTAVLPRSDVEKVMNDKRMITSVGYCQYAVNRKC